MILNIILWIQKLTIQDWIKLIMSTSGLKQKYATDKINVLFNFILISLITLNYGLSTITSIILLIIGSLFFFKEFI